MAGAATDANAADQRQDQVLGGNAGGQRAGDVDGASPGPALQQALGGEHVANFGGADAEGEGAEGAVRAGVAVAADHGLAGLRKTKFRTDDVHDAAQLVAQIEQLEPELCAVALELGDLPCGRVNAERRVAEYLLGACRRRMVHGGERQIRASHP